MSVIARAPKLARFRATRWATASLLLGSFTLGLAGVALATPQTSGDQVTICQATNSDNKPYVQITLSINAADGSLANGNGDHTTQTGPVWEPTLKAQHIQWGDIIPPYSYAVGSYPGLNWTADGQAIWNNGCAIPGTSSPSPSPSGSASGSPSESPSVSPSASPTVSPSASLSGSPSESPSASPSESPSVSPTTTTTDTTAPTVYAANNCVTGISVVLGNLDGTVPAAFTVTTPAGAIQHLSVAGGKMVRLYYPVKEDTTGTVTVRAAGLSTHTFSYAKNCTTVLGEKVTRTPAVSGSPVSGGTLPFTGFGTSQALWLASLALLLGSAFCWLAGGGLRKRRPRRHA